MTATPDSPVLALARLYLSRGQADMALRSLRTVPEAEVLDLDLLNAWGVMEAQAGDDRRGIELLMRARSLARPLPADLANNLGFLLQRAGRWDEALAVYDEGLAAAPADAALLMNRGLCLKQAGRASAALEAFDRLLALQPKSIEAWTNRANALSDLGRLDEALAAHQQALALAPEHPVVLCNLSSTLSQLHRGAEALDAAGRALSAAPDHATAWLRKGLALQTLGRFGEAVASYERAVALQPDLIQAQQSLAGLRVAGHGSEAQAAQATERSLHLELQRQSAAAPAQVALFRLKHDLQQAEYLAARGAPVPGLDAYLQRAQAVLGRGDGSGAPLPLRADDWAAMAPYLRTPWVAPAPELAHALNPDNDWADIEAAYLRGAPEMLYIDQFLHPEALASLRRYCLESRLWLTEYQGKYLGAFANQGFLSPLHFQIARELRARMPRVFGEHPLNQLWGFKYDARLGTGIGVHADFAAVNLNFWITPDEYNLAPEAGGLKVYHVPAPRDWTFYQYNNDVSRIYGYLKEHGSDCLTVPYRCNRAVLFNSTLFHETDRIDFVDRYEARRINVTYLFGRQLW